jgi:hypothetical protein
MNDCCAPKKDNGKAYDLAVIGALAASRRPYPRAGRRSRGGDFSLSHHGRGYKTRGAGLLQGCRDALLLRGLARYGYHYESIRGLGWQHAHEAIGVVASSRRVGCRGAGRCAGSNSHLDRRPRLDGRGMHSQCAALRTDALPVHRAVLSLYDYSGALARAGCRSGRPIWMTGSRSLHYPRQQNDMVGDGARAGKVLVDIRIG